MNIWKKKHQLWYQPITLKFLCSCKVPYLVLFLLKCVGNKFQKEHFITSYYLVLCLVAVLKVIFHSFLLSNVVHIPAIEEKLEIFFFINVTIHLKFSDLPHAISEFIKHRSNACVHHYMPLAPSTAGIQEEEMFC